jgi:hypothetical protein
MAYAVDTKVPVERSRQEIERVVQKYGANKFATAIDNQSRIVVIEFAMRNRRLRFELHQPPDTHPQKLRSAWRALLLAIKAKLESVASGIETFDEAFLAHVVMPDGRRFGEIVIPQLEGPTQHDNG